MNIADIRRDYLRGGLRRTALEADPLKQFEKWFADAGDGRSCWRRVGIALFKLWRALLGRPPADANAMVLATVNRNGVPSTRTVLLKGLDQRGFIFYTNHDSRKGRDLLENPNAALTFYWPDWERQVCVRGRAERIPRDEAEAYFKTRPRGSQLAAWASNQCDVVADRAVLDAAWDAVAAKFPGAVALPPNWGGYVLNPEQIEFWQGRPNRLHDRFQFRKQADNSWKLDRLAP